MFPLSNWTELDVWQYIHLENIPIVPLYFAKERPMVVRGGALIPVEQRFMPLLPGEKPQMVMCRMRSLGCTPCTGAIRSEADTVPKIIEEMMLFRRSRAREPRHRSRPGRLDGDQEARGLLLMPWQISARRASWRKQPKTAALHTAGSVDDGKSTLIGRLLYDSKGVYEDQLASVAKASANRTAGPIDLSLLTDGLRAEREQGITIDVAYRYFSTPRRKFIIADTPGHEQYTRNMATGASTANLAIILIDARNGVLPQSRRHAFIAALLGIPHFVVAVNKMDLVDFDHGRLRRHPRGIHGISPPHRSARTAIHSPSARATAITWWSAARRPLVYGSGAAGVPGNRAGWRTTDELCRRAFPCST